MTSPWWPGVDHDSSRILISALEHFAYCPRQAALIHVDGLFTDDVNTVLGNIAHRHVDQPATRHASAPGVRVITRMPVWSDRLGLYGICDSVEITTTGVTAIEHKVGRHVAGGPGEVQAVAQALCLREMLGREPTAVIFSHADRRRHAVEMTESTVARVERSIVDLRVMLRGNGEIPLAVNDARCKRCSLRDDCLPELTCARIADDPYMPKPLGNWDG